MNNPKKEHQSLGDWMREYGIKPEQAVLWPIEPTLATSIIEDANAKTVTGLSPGGYPLPNRHPENLEVEDAFTHNYEGSDFDLEYGWAVADDVKSAIEPLVDPENNLHQYEYPDQEERDRALNTAFSQLTDTTDRLLKNEGAAVFYNLESVGRYQLPDLAKEPSQNQIRYGERIATQLERRGFDAEIIEDPDYSRNTHVLGRR